MEKELLDYTLDALKTLLAVDSPTGFSKNAADTLLRAFAALEIPAKRTEKGGVLADLSMFAAEDADAGNGILLSAHIDTLGAMVRQIKGNGRLKVTNVGGLNANNTETEFVRV